MRALHFTAAIVLLLSCGDDGPSSDGDSSRASGGMVGSSSTSNEPTIPGSVSTTGSESGDDANADCPDVLAGDLRLDTAQSVEAARGIRHVTGSVFITGEVESLEPLGCLESIDGALSINATSLRDLGGLEALTEIGDQLWVHANPELESLGRLQSLRFAASIRMSGNGLTELGLSQLQGTREIVIGDCISDDGVDSMLQDFAGLESLLGIGTVSIHHSPELTALSGLHAFAERGGSLSILRLWVNEQLDPATISELSDAFGGVSLDVCGNAGDDPEKCFCPPPP